MSTPKERGIWEGGHQYGILLGKQVSKMRENRRQERKRERRKMYYEGLDVIYENPSGQLLDITRYDVNTSTVKLYPLLKTLCHYNVVILD